MTSEPATTTALATGAVGERAVAARLEKACGDQVLFLHNRKLGRGRRDGDIDHIAIAPTGVFVIDAKNYHGVAIEVRRSGGLFGPRVERHFIGGRDRRGLLEGLTKQRRAVALVMGQHPTGLVTEIHALLCFVNMPMFGGDSVHGVPLLGPRGTGKLLRRPGPLDQAAREALHRHLAGQLACRVRSPRPAAACSPSHLPPSAGSERAACPGRDWGLSIYPRFIDGTPARAGHADRGPRLSRPTPDAGRPARPRLTVPRAGSPAASPTIRSDNAKLPDLPIASS